MVLLHSQDTEGPRGAWKFDANGYVGDVSPVVGIRLPLRDYGAVVCRQPEFLMA